MTSNARKILVTGSSGLIGSEVCAHMCDAGWEVHGIDNNQRAVFFGPQGDTRRNQMRLQTELKGFTHHELDIRERHKVLELIARVKPDALVHAAGQPSHDLAAKIPFDDFEVNALGTLNLLEAMRRHACESPFVFLSTNKVYGDRPNQIALRETETRWEYADSIYEHGISEDFNVDQSMHSLFGVSKTSADLMVQEYGRYFNMPTCCLRCGCLSGPRHAGVELHGFLSYLIKSNVARRPYTIYGHKGKQVRDNIHSYDVARFIESFIAAPRSAEVYNIGGGLGNTCSILEAFKLAEKYSGASMQYSYVEQSRLGDHICYYSDLRKAQNHFPNWEITKSLDAIFEEIASYWMSAAGT